MLVQHTAWLIALLTITACGTTGDATSSTASSSVPADSTPVVDAAHNSRNALDWPGTYVGTPPRPEGPGTVTTLRIYDTQQYTLSLETPGPEGDTVELGGYFDWRPDGGSIQLMGFNPEHTPTYFLIGENQLFQLPLDGKRDEGALDPASRLARVTTSLTDTEWRLASVENAPLPDDVNPPTLLLTPDGEASGMAGCNSFRGTYRLDQNRLYLSPLATTKMACPNLETENDYLYELATVVNYRMGEGELVLFNEKSEVVLRFNTLGD